MPRQGRSENAIQPDFHVVGMLTRRCIHDILVLKLARLTLSDRCMIWVQTSLIIVMSIQKSLQALISDSETDTQIESTCIQLQDKFSSQATVHAALLSCKVWSSLVQLMLDRLLFIQIQSSLPYKRQISFLWWWIRRTMLATMFLIVSVMRASASDVIEVDIPS